VALLLTLSTCVLPVKPVLLWKHSKAYCSVSTGACQE